MGNPKIEKCGTQEWYLDGKRHRTDAPAVIHANGTQMWYLDSKLHRTDGPAYISTDGHLWWLNDFQYNFDEWLDISDISGEEKVMMKLQYG